MKMITINILILLIIFTTGCKEDPVQPKNEGKLTLEKIDASCTEAWLQLTTENIQLPAEINIKRTDANGSNKDVIFYVSTKDTLLYIDSLLPNKTYQFQSVIHSINQSSNLLNVTTMDTTSHNFTFRTWTFGDIGSSSLSDVAIIGENNIWAVGEIRMSDSINGETVYNAVHWDGNEWELKRIEVNFRGNVIVPPLEGAFTFSATDIWFVGSLPIHGDGENWTIYDLRTTVDPYLSLSKCWGSSSSDMYFVGRSGSIAHYNGSQWQKIESETQEGIGDIWGVPNGTGGFDKYCTTSNTFFKITENNEITSINVPSDIYISSVWGLSNRLLYTAGNGIVLYRNKEWIRLKDYEVSTVKVVRGLNHNEVFGRGVSGIIEHFNGYSWKKTYTNTNNTHYFLDTNKNIAVAVGWQNNKALITILRRN